MATLPGGLLTYTYKPTTQAELTAMRNVIHDATGQPAPNNFAIGTTITLTQQSWQGPFLVSGMAIVPPPPVAPKPTPSSSSISISSILTASLLVEGGIALYNAATNNSKLTPSTTTNTVTTSTAGTTAVQNPAPPAEVAPASDPGVVVGAPIATPTVDTEFGNLAGAQIDNATATSIDATGLDAAIAQQAVIAEKETISEVDVQAGIDEAIQAQQDAEDQRAFDSGYNNIADLQAAENQQALDQVAAQAELDQSIQNLEPPIVNEDPAETARLLNSTIVGPDESAAETARLKGLSADKAAAQAAQTAQDAANAAAKPDWRVRLSLAPNSTYLYNAGQGKDAGILKPLYETKGVIFPYTPAISVAYAAHYDPATLIHSNYKIFQYNSSSVDSITITCDFTAQDNAEADYLLAVIHFFKSVTKMFYGKDQNPMRGTPPPLCYLTGMGQFQFDQHPLAITGFTYTLPTDVDYIRTGKGTVVPGASAPSGGTGGTPSPTETRTTSSAAPVGGANPPPVFSGGSAKASVTYVPTKMQLSITAIPIVSRNDISNRFSLKDYATGGLLQGSISPNRGGIW